MRRILRAFVWLRWRIFVNSLGHAGSRDALERVSLVLERAVPVIFTIMMIPAALAMGVFGGLAGYSIATGNMDLPFLTITRIALTVAFVMALVGPLVVGGGNATNPVRLMLLPVPQGLLYAAQCLSAISNPWVLVVLPALVGLPAGLVIGGAIGAGAVAAAGGLLVLIAILGLSSLTGTLLHLVMRNRRRAEVMALVLIVVGPALGLTLSNAAAGPGRSDRSAQESREARRARRARPMPAWINHTTRVASLVLPSEQYRTSVLAAAEGRGARALSATGLLAAVVLLLHAGGLTAFRWVLTSPDSSGSRRGTATPYPTAAVPFVAPGVSAVALAQWRLLVRSTRGRSIILSPLVLVLVFGALMLRNGDASIIAGLPIGGGLSLALLGLTTLTLGLLQVLANQFGVDPSGLRRMLLGPLSTDDVLRGKAMGTFMAGAASALVIMAVAFSFAPGGAPALWASLPLGFAAMHLVGAPVAAILAASLPRKANLNTLGSQGNANGLAMWLAIMAYLAAALPPVAIVLVALLLLGNPVLAPALLLVWTVVAYAISRLLFVAARWSFDQRRENLALIGGGPSLA